MTNTIIYINEYNIYFLHKAVVDKDIYIILNEISDTDISFKLFMCF